MSSTGEEFIVAPCRLTETPVILGSVFYNLHSDLSNVSSRINSKPASFVVANGAYLESHYTAN